MDTLFFFVKQWCRMIIYITTLLTLWHPSQAQETQKEEKLKPLTVGDTIPEKLWQMSLKVMNHPEGRDSIKLNDYRDEKLIILDFWATWCGSCLNSIRKVREFPKSTSENIIFITKQTKHEIEKSKSIEHFLGNYLPFSVVEDSILSRLLDSYSLPHVIWIEHGKLKAITTGKQLTNEKIQQALRNDWGEIINKMDTQNEINLYSQGKEMEL